MRLLDVRLAFRLHRFEIVGIGLLLAIVAVASVWLAWRLDATGYGANCSLTGNNAPDCEVMGRSFYEQQAQVPLVQGLLIALPFLLGILVGVPLVARELERGTARLAWSLAPSRSRWFLLRLLPLLAVVSALSFAAAVALDHLLAALEPWADPSRSFAAFGARGIVFAARSVLVFAVGVAVGSAIGRVLPAMIVTAVIASVSIAGGADAHQRLLLSEAVCKDVGPDGMLPPGTGDLYVDQRFRLPDGRIVTWEVAERMDPPPADGSEWNGPRFPVVDLVVPGERYQFAEMRETAALAAASVGALVIAGFVVRRRRPG